MSEPLILYHAGCVDGFTAAWAVNKANGGEICPASYSDPPPDVTGRDVFVVDFHYDRETTLRMKEQARWMLVLDHHKEAEKEIGDLDFCIFDNDRSGATIAWDYCHGERSRPWIVEYAEDRDLWRWKLPNSRAVNAFLQAQEQTLWHWDHLAKSPLHHVVEKGEVVLMAIDHYISQHKRNASLVEFEGHLVPIINAPYWHMSELLEHLALTPLRPGSTPYDKWIDCATIPGQGRIPPFAMGWYRRGDGKTVFSLRSKPREPGGEPVDVGAIAKEYGGGGHKPAAGFVLSALSRPHWV